jgi:hypothetical protein
VVDILVEISYQHQVVAKSSSALFSSLFDRDLEKLQLVPSVPVALYRRDVTSMASYEKLHGVLPVWPCLFGILSKDVVNIVISIVVSLRTVPFGRRRSDMLSSGSVSQEDCHGAFCPGAQTLGRHYRSLKEKEGRTIGDWFAIPLAIFPRMVWHKLRLESIDIATRETTKLFSYFQ